MIAIHNSGYFVLAPIDQIRLEPFTLHPDTKVLESFAAKVNIAFPAALCSSLLYNPLPIQLKMLKNAAPSW